MKRTILSVSLLLAVSLGGLGCGSKAANRAPEEPSGLPAPPPGQSHDCGGMQGLMCDSGEYCHYQLEAMCGAADQMGSCRVIPQMCTEEYAPVCGCDDTTYSNGCKANAAGISVALEGACPSAPLTPPEATD